MTQTFESGKHRTSQSENGPGTQQPVSSFHTSSLRTGYRANHSHQSERTVRMGLHYQYSVSVYSAQLQTLGESSRKTDEKTYHRHRTLRKFRHAKNNEYLTKS